MKYYHVSYQYTKNSGFGFGSITLELKKPIKTGKDVKMAAEHIEKVNGFNKVIVLNWIPLKGW